MKLYNTLSRKTETFKEIKKGHVGLYTCGPTVYNFAHIGNFRAYVCGDILKRYLEYKGFSVRHIMNITDVDDKTIKGAKEEGLSLSKFAEKYETAFFEDLEALNIEKAHVYPRATDHIDEMVAMIKELLKKGIAYRAEDGSIYYDISKFKDYGKLSKIKVEALQEGASQRVSNDEYEKEQANDFALWKAWDENDGQVFWETEIGKGRPGWHIECSAMSTKYLGEHFDIHGGGIDLIFPHHENEIAQSSGATGKKFVNFWFHNEYLMVEGKKMSKRFGNFYTLRDLLSEGFSPKAIRFLLMSAHYKVPLNFTKDGLKSADETITRFKEFMSKLKEADGKESKVEKLIASAKSEFEKNLDNDLNISGALASVFEFMREINRLFANDKISRQNSKEVVEFMESLDKVLGFLEFKDYTVPKEIMELVQEREEARKRKDFASSDRLRQDILKKGWQLDDTKDGTRVKKAE